ncbi:MAG: hypothetical protein H6502_02700 [Candidatus Woesearchaeota archaeon]|nr:MAG: hypothetical protein H6502_02700 [Candidatus Woesearchaeota archaeon]
MVTVRSHVAEWVFGGLVALLGLMSLVVFLFSFAYSYITLAIARIELTIIVMIIILVQASILVRIYDQNLLLYGRTKRK